jgi:tRNA(Ser,Leu) C12 N-acetylase TAN1
MKQATLAKRKRRSDRNHIAYRLTAPNGLVYVGITHVEGTPLKSLNRRWLKHVNRAKNDGKDWALCCAIREFGSEAFRVEIIERIRGKTAAHAREVELIAELQPQLNTAKTGRRAQRVG